MTKNYGLKDVKDVQNDVRNIQNDVVLKEVRISGNICGEFVELSMKQVYQNQGRDDIDAEYIFPIPDTAVMTGFEANLGGRILKAQVENKMQADAIYKIALENGSKTLSLEEIDDNVFKISIGKILSNETVKIKVSYIDQLIYEDHNLKLIVPTVIGPQYISNKSEIKANNEVSDDDYKLRLNLLVEPLTKIVIESPSHDVEVEWDENNLARVSFKDEDAYLDEEFVLVFKEENQQEASGMIYDYEQDDESKGILYLRLIPDLESNEEEESKNYDFLIDISESMEGEKIEQAKNALQLCIRNLSEGDSFNIVAAENELHYFSQYGKVSFNEENLSRASTWIENLQVLDDAEIFDALKYCLSESNNIGNSIIMVFTDDEGETDDEIIEYVTKNIGDNRIFTFGMNTSSNSYFINKLAEVGYGRPEFIYQGERIEDMVLRQLNRIENPQVDVMKINWGSMKVESTYPRTIDYFYDDEPFSMFAKVAGEIEGKITITGKVGKEDYEKTINLDSLDLEENLNLIQKIWIRKRIESMEEKLKTVKGTKAEVMKEKVIELSKDSGIISTETTFIMIEEFYEPLLGMVMTNIIPLQVSEEAMKNITEAYFIESPSFIYKATNKDGVLSKKVFDEKNIVDIKLNRENMLRILAKNQFADGAIANVNESNMEKKIESTAIAMLAFTLGKDDINIYANQLQKSIKLMFKFIGDNVGNIKLDLVLLTALALKSSIVKGLAKGSLKLQIEQCRAIDITTVVSLKEIVRNILNFTENVSINEELMLDEKNSIYDLALTALYKVL